jgi:protein TonB
LPLLEYTLPEYPTTALREGIEGWVDVEFVIGEDGGPREIIAVAAEPLGRFEEAALAAVANYRYRPFELDGRIYERRLRLRLRFTLERE